MGKYPRIKINLKKLKHNAESISTLAKRQDISIFAVTKATCGDLKVAKVLLKGGAKGIGDSRVENIKNLKKAGIKTDFMLLRTPMLSEVEDVLNYADISLNSELSVISKLSKEAKKLGKKHMIILMVEMGDLREGIMKHDLESTIKEILEKHKGVELYGIGMNLACFGGVIPTEDKILEFENLVENLEDKFEINFKIISGGNSANITLLLKNTNHNKINNLRIGEGILLGLETVNRTPIPNTYQDAFILEVEIIELKEKPSIPNGKMSQNAFGEVPRFEDYGIISRGILGIGRQDLIIEDLTPLDPNIRILGGSSDHILLYIKSKKYKVGDVVRFTLNYGALVHLFTSKYVKKDYI